MRDRLENKIKHFLMSKGEYPMSQAIDKLCRFVKHRVSPVLIVGESGCGKEFVARVLMSNGTQFDKSEFAKHNCGAIQDELLMSELFGHVKGAFTGAVSDRLGILESSKGGIFLDEVDKSSRSFQDAMLRYIRNSEIRKVGSDAVETVRPAQLVFATSQPQESVFKSRRLKHAKLLIENKNIRISALSDERVEALKSEIENLNSYPDSCISHDFLNRLSTFVIEVPPLRQRKEDLGIMLNRFINTASSELGVNVTMVSGEVIDFVAAYDWPNNIAELEAFVRLGLLWTENGLFTIWDWALGEGTHPRNLLFLVMGLMYDNRKFFNRIAGYLRLGYRHEDHQWQLELTHPDSSSSEDPKVRRPGNPPRYGKPLRVKMCNLERAFDNMLFWREVESGNEKLLNALDTERVEQYFRLRFSYQYDKDIYTEMGFKSIRPFKNWLRNNRLDH